MSPVWYIILSLLVIIIIGATVQFLLEKNQQASQPKFKVGSCPVYSYIQGSEFIGHYLTYDIYLYQNTIIARYGNKNWENRVENLDVFLSGVINSPEYIFSETALNYHKAIILALLSYYSNNPQKSTCYVGPI